MESDNLAFHSSCILIGLLKREPSKSCKKDDTAVKDKGKDHFILEREEGRQFPTNNHNSCAPKRSGKNLIEQLLFTNHQLIEKHHAQPRGEEIKSYHRKLPNLFFTFKEIWSFLIQISMLPFTVMSSQNLFWSEMLRLILLALFQNNTYCTQLIMKSNLR